MIENLSNIVFNTTTNNFIVNNLTPGQSFAQICELNQYAMLKQTQQFPFILWYLMIWIASLLIIEVLILPRLSYSWVDPLRGWFVKIAMTTIPAPLFFTFLLVYQPSPEFMNNTINPIIIAITVLLILVLIWDKRKILIELYQEFKKPKEEKDNERTKKI